MNIDKQIWEVIYKHVDPFRKKGDEPIEDFVVYCDNDCFDEMIPQIKQSILKAIMEGKPKREPTVNPYEQKIGIVGIEYGYDQATEEFESVIKEVLGDSKDNKI